MGVFVGFRVESPKHFRHVPKNQGGGFAGLGCTFFTIADILENARSVTGVDVANCAASTARGAAEGALIGATGAVSLKAFGSIAGGTIRASYNTKAFKFLFGQGKGIFNGGSNVIVNGKRIGYYLRVGVSRDNGNWSFRAGGVMVQGFKKKFTQLTGKTLPGNANHWIILSNLGAPK